MESLDLKFLASARGERWDFNRSALDGMAHAIAQFGDEMRPAVMRTLNRAVEGMPPHIVKIITANYSIPSRRVRSTLRVSHADLKGMTAVVRMTSGAVPLFQFGAKPNQPGYNRSGVVTVDVMGRKSVPGSVFIAKMKNGHVGIWKRTSNGPRFPIHELFGPSVSGMWNGLTDRMGDGTTNDAVFDAVEDRFMRRLPHEIDRLLAKMGAK